MRVSEDEFITELVANISYIKLSLLTAYLGIETDVEEHIAQLLLDIHHIVLHQSIAQLEGLLYGVGAQTLIGLLTVPGTLLPQVVQHVQQPAEGCHLLFSGMRFHIVSIFFSSVPP